MINRFKFNKNFNTIIDAASDEFLVDCKTFVQSPDGKITDLDNRLNSQQLCMVLNDFEARLSALEKKQTASTSHDEIQWSPKLKSLIKFFIKLTK